MKERIILIGADGPIGSALGGYFGRLGIDNVIISGVRSQKEPEKREFFLDCRCPG